jgi:hypothetical protein
MKSLIKYRQIMDQFKGRHALAGQTVTSERNLLKKAEWHTKRVIEAQQIIQEVAQKLQQSAHARLCAIISRCLSTVFDTPYTMTINFVKRRGKTEADIKFLRDGYAFDPIEETGGGCVQVAAFGALVCDLLFAKPKRRLFLPLDEPFVGLDEMAMPRAAQLVEELNAELGIQFLIITQRSDFRAGKVITF